MQMLIRWILRFIELQEAKKHTADEILKDLRDMLKYGLGR